MKKGHALGVAILRLNYPDLLTHKGEFEVLIRLGHKGQAQTRREICRLHIKSPVSFADA